MKKIWMSFFKLVILVSIFSLVSCEDEVKLGNGELVVVNNTPYKLDFQINAGKGYLETLSLPVKGSASSLVLMQGTYTGAVLSNDLARYKLNLGLSTKLYLVDFWSIKNQNTVVTIDFDEKTLEFVARIDNPSYE